MLCPLWIRLNSQGRKTMTENNSGNQQGLAQDDLRRDEEANSDEASVSGTLTIRQSVGVPCTVDRDPHKVFAYLQENPPADGQVAFIPTNNAGWEETQYKGADGKPIFIPKKAVYAQLVDARLEEGRRQLRRSIFLPFKEFGGGKKPSVIIDLCELQEMDNPVAFAMENGFHLADANGSEADKFPVALLRQIIMSGFIPNPYAVMKIRGNGARKWSNIGSPFRTHIIPHWTANKIPFCGFSAELSIQDERLIVRVLETANMEYTPLIGTDDAIVSEARGGVRNVRPLDRCTYDARRMPAFYRAAVYRHLCRVAGKDVANKLMPRPERGGRR